MHYSIFRWKKDILSLCTAFPSKSLKNLIKIYEPWLNNGITCTNIPQKAEYDIAWWYQCQTEITMPTFTFHNLHKQPYNYLLIKILRTVDLTVWWTPCLISFPRDQSTCQVRVESDKIRNEKFLPTFGFEPIALRSEVLPTELRGLCWKLYYLNGLYTYIYFRYQCIHWHKFDNDGVQIILSCKCTVLWIFDIFLDLYIGIYLYCTKGKGSYQSFVYFARAKHDQTFYLTWCLHVESKRRTWASLCYLYHIDIFKYVTQNSSTFTRHNTHWIILELIPMNTLVSEVHVCIKAI